MLYADGVNRQGAPLFSVDVAETDAATELKLRGECDLSSVDELSERLEAAIAGGKTMVVDLSELSFLDSSCLRALIAAYEQVGRNGRLTLRRGPDNVMRIFEIAGLSDTLPFE
jgi:anti-sigma B factor antagonist